MQDLYKGFKKISEDEKGAVLQHENGHKLNIAKSGLNKKQISMLKKLPLYQAQGTSVFEEDQNPENELQQIGREITGAITENIIKGATGATATKIPQEITPQQIEQMPEPTATSVETGEPIAPAIGAPTPEERFSQYLQQKQQPGAYNQVVAPLDILAESLSPGGGQKSAQELKQQILETRQAKAQQEQQDLEQAQLLKEQSQLTQEGLAQGPLAEEPLAEQPKPEIAPSLPQLTKPISIPSIIRPPEEVMYDPKVSESERAAAFIEASANIQRQIVAQNEAFRAELEKPENKINPNRFWEDMSAPRRVMTVIGMLLSGYAEGLSGRESSLLKILDKEVERDIQAQMQSREDKSNLFKQNLAVLKDTQAAYLQTATQLRSIMDMKMQESLRKLDPTNQLGKSALMAGIAENQAKIAESTNKLTKIELNKKYQEGIKRGEYVEIPDELDERKDRIVRVMGPKGGTMKFYSRTPGAAEKLQERASAYSTAYSVLQKINQFNTQYGRQFELAGPIETSMADAANTLNQAAVFAVQDLLTKGQLSPRNEKLIQDIFPKAGALKQGDAQQKAIQSAALINLLNQELIKTNLTK